MTDRIFQADVDSVSPRYGVVALIEAHSRLVKKWKLTRDSWKVQNICPALPYEFRSRNGSETLHSWAPQLPSPEAVARFLAYCQVPRKVAKRIAAESLLEDAVGALADAGVDGLPLEMAGRFLPAGYAALSARLLHAGASHVEIEQIHAYLLENEVAPERYVSWLEDHAFDLADNEEVDAGFKVLDDLSRVATPAERASASLSRFLFWREREGDTVTTFGWALNTVAEQVGVELPPYVKGGERRQLPSPLEEVFWSNSFRSIKIGAEKKLHIARNITAMREWDAVNGLVEMANRRPRTPLRVEELDLELSAGQASAVDFISRHGLTVLVGPAGTGKTAVVRAVANALAMTGKSVAMTATTGRASKVLDPENGITLHRFLGVVPGARWLRRSEPVDLLVIDEASMLDNSLASPLGKFLSEVGAKRVIIVGDPYQIPPVGAGRILYDLIHSSVTSSSVVELTEVRRTKRQGILDVATAIRSGAPIPEIPEGGPVEVYDLADERGFAADMLVKMVAPHAHADRLVISANYMGPLGVYSLNRALRDAHLGKSDDDWMVGERVVQARTFREKAETEPKDADEKVEPVAANEKDLTIIANGTFGQIIEITDTSVVVAYEDGVVHEWTHREVTPGRGMIDPAYALTVHRAQGSQATTAFVVVDPDYPTMWEDPALGYTAVTRAVDRLVIFGDLETLAGDRSKSEVERRATAFAERARRKVGQ